jgi:hypothetical protein
LDGQFAALLVVLEVKDIADVHADDLPPHARDRDGHGHGAPWQLEVE